MTIDVSEFVIYRSLGIDDSVPANNGGRINTAAPVASLVLNGHFPQVLPAERTAGDSKWRKMFGMVRDAEQGFVTDARMFLRGPTADGAITYMREGDWDDADSEGTPFTTRKYGVATLAASVTGGATSINFLVEDAAEALNIFQSGDTVVIRENDTQEEYVTIGAPTLVSGNEFTVTFTPALGNTYTLNVATVAGCINYNQIRSVTTTPVISGAGTLNQALMVINNEGAQRQNWTLTFTSATAFTAAGDSVGAIAGGDTGTPYTPIDANLGQPFFTIPNTAWGGTFAASDTVTFTITPCGLVFWLERVIPAGSATSSNEIALTRFTGLEQTP